MNKIQEQATQLRDRADANKDGHVSVAEGSYFVEGEIRQYPRRAMAIGFVMGAFSVLLVYLLYAIVR
jgi:hypothetical protein